MSSEEDTELAVRRLAQTCSSVTVGRDDQRHDGGLLVFQVVGRRHGDTKLAVMTVVAQGGSSASYEKWVELYDKFANDFEQVLERNE